MTTTSPALLRFKRALDLIPFITKNPGWTKAELASHFGVTLQEIARDLVTLHMCGLPGYSHGEMLDLIYDDDFVEVTNSQNLAQPRDLTSDERNAIILGLEMAKQISSDPEMTTQIQKLQAKLQGKQMENIARSVDVSRAINDSPHRKTIMEALASKRELDFTYISSKDTAPTARRISPIRMYQIGERVYVEGYCPDSAGIRNFRTDRMVQCSVSDRPRAIPSNLPSEFGVHKVKVLLDLSARLFLEENRQIVTATEHVGDQILATFELGDLDWLLSAIIALPGSRAILEPDSAIARAREILTEIKSLY